MGLYTLIKFSQKWGDDNLKGSRSRAKAVTEENDDQFLPDDDRRGENEDEIYISPELRVLMSRYDNSKDLSPTVC